MTADPSSAEEEAPKIDAPNNEPAQGQWQPVVPEVASTNQASTSSEEQQQSLKENNQLLRALTNYIVKEKR